MSSNRTDGAPLEAPGPPRRRGRARAQRRASSPLLGALLSLWALYACDSQRSYYVISRESIVAGATVHQLGGACNVINERSGTTSTAAGVASYERAEGSLRVEAVDDGQVRFSIMTTAASTERVLGEDWLRGHDSTETLELPIDAKRSYRVELHATDGCP